MIHNYLIGHRNARPQTARRLGELTGSDPFLWMAGGSPSERQAAVNNWALHASSIADKQPAVQEQL